MIKISSSVPDTVNEADEVPVLRELTLGDTESKYTKKYPTFQIWTVLRKKQNGIQMTIVPRGRSGSYCFIQGGWRRVQ